MWSFFIRIFVSMLRFLRGDSIRYGFFNFDDVGNIYEK